MAMPIPPVAPISRDFLVGKFGGETGCLRHCDFCKVHLGSRSKSRKHSLEVNLKIGSSGDLLRN